LIKQSQTALVRLAPFLNTVSYSVLINNKTKFGSSIEVTLDD